MRDWTDQPATATIEKIALKNGNKIATSEGDIVIIVGPNNSGKSALLSDLKNFIFEINPKTISVDKLILRKRGTYDNLIDRLNGGYIHPEGRPNHWKIPADNSGSYGVTTNNAIDTTWRSDEPYLREISGAFAIHIKTIDRLMSCAPSPAKHKIDDLSSNPLQKIASDPVLEKKISDSFFSAFGEGLCIRRFGQSNALHIGHPPSITGANIDAFAQYERDVAALPPIDQQGDGMRSYAGILINSLASDNDIILIDEPEAFLHPPQAYRIAQTLCDGKSNHKQYFLATHSSDILRGALSASGANIRIIRLERINNNFTARELTPDSVRTILDDPILRYSNALDGVFHKLTIVCEGDADCRLFHAIIDAQDKLNGVPARDVMFTHCGGKTRMHVVVQALTALKVPVRAAPDIDILNEELNIERLVLAAGGKWDDYRHDWKIVKDWVDAKSLSPSIIDVKEKISKILDDSTASTLSKRDANDIRSAIKRMSAWGEMKRIGKYYLKAGAVLNAFNTLQSNLEAIGIFMNPAGETESLDENSGDNHGPAHVKLALQRDLLGDPALQAARDYVSALVK